jgi:hypothetical protein
MYGLTRVKNSPSCSGAPSGCTQLVSIDVQTGTLVGLGHGVPTLAAVGDLNAIDSEAGIYYFLGDGWNGTGTILVGLSLANGSTVCQRNLNHFVKTEGIVGGGQSLDIVDSVIRITGLPNASSSSHVLLTFPVGTKGCGQGWRMSVKTSFPYSGMLPVAHATTLYQHTLYTTVSTSPHEYGIAGT